LGSKGASKKGRKEKKKAIKKGNRCERDSKALTMERGQKKNGHKKGRQLLHRPGPAFRDTHSLLSAEEKKKKGLDPLTNFGKGAVPKPVQPTKKEKGKREGNVKGGINRKQTPKSKTGKIALGTGLSHQKKWLPRLRFPLFLLGGRGFPASGPGEKKKREN